MKSNIRAVYQKLNSLPHRNMSTVMLFAVGMFVGLSLAILYKQYRLIMLNQSQYYSSSDIDAHIMNLAIGDYPHNSTSNQNRKNIQMHSPDDEVHAIENSTVASKLYKNVRILCLVLTTPATHKSKAFYVKSTWGKRCNKLVFVSSKNDTELSPIVFNMTDNVKTVWSKTKRSFQHIYKHNLHDADWFLKADEDTYVIMENLRYFLAAFSPDDPLHFGYKVKDAVKQGYFAGGAGYVLSREAVTRLVERAIPSAAMCRADGGGYEDVEMGKCLENVQAIAGDTRDAHGRERFFVNTPEFHLIAGKPDLTRWSKKWYKMEPGLDCCSDNPISFHNIRPNMMHVMEYLIYHLRPFGIVGQPQPLPKKLNFIDLVHQSRGEKP